MTGRQREGAGLEVALISSGGGVMGGCGAGANLLPAVDVP